MKIHLNGFEIPGAPLREHDLTANFHGPIAIKPFKLRHKPNGADLHGKTAEEAKGNRLG